MQNYLEGYDYSAIHKRAKEVILNTKRLKKSAVDKYMNYFHTKCLGSKNTIEEAKKLIPGGIQHNLANNYPFAINCVKAEGPYLYDIDGNRYIDFLQAGGPTILGNNYPPITKVVIETLKNIGSLTGLYGDYELEFAKAINRYYPSVEKFRMLASGTEAAMVAIRLARAYTNKKNVIKIKGCYHGWSDQLMYELRSFGSKFEAAVGVPEECYRYIQAVTPNDLLELEQQFKENEAKGGTATFIMESIGQDSGALPLTQAYHEKARELCDHYGAVLIYDEVVTAFRIGMGGAQAHYCIKPDLTVFGKVIAGGYHGGGVGGKSEIMNLLTAGITLGHSTKVMVGGTLTANPISCKAGYTTICELERTDAHKKLKKASDAFIKDVADLANKYQIPSLIFNQESILHIDLCGMQHVSSFTEWSKKEIEKFTALAMQAMHEYAMAMAAEGIIVAGGNKSYINLQTVDVLDDALSAIERVFSQYE